jgi:hypothetical protein
MSFPPQQNRTARQSISSDDSPGMKNTISYILWNFAPRGSLALHVRGKLQARSRMSSGCPASKSFHFPPHACLSSAYSTLCVGVVQISPFVLPVPSLFQSTIPIYYIPKLSTSTVRYLVELFLTSRKVAGASIDCLFFSAGYENTQGYARMSRAWKSSRKRRMDLSVCALEKEPDRYTMSCVGAASFEISQHARNVRTSALHRIMVINLV